MRKTIGNFALLVIVVLALSGCSTLAIEGAQATKAEAIIALNIDEARAGDAEAQYKVGQAHCCSIHEGSGIYNTKTAVAWLCQAARQDYAPAMVMLGKIYSGDVIDGVRLSRRVIQGVAGSSTDIPVALTWFQLAMDRGELDASDQAAGLWDDLSAAEKDRTRAIYAQGLNAPCDWEDVIES